MNAAPASGALVDPGMVRAFVRMVHDAAARAMDGVEDPGALQLGFLVPGGVTLQTTRFAIGHVDAMADSAISAASNGLNVYIEPRTVDAKALRRGDADATRGAWALVDDSDGDKGKAGALTVTPTWVVESSPGNRHSWFVLDRALTADEAKPLGAAMRKAIGSDSATGKVTQPFRVAGTPNYPDAKKRARGRTVCSTRVLDMAGPVWSAAQLAEAFPPIKEPDAEASASSAGRSGATSGTFDDLIAEEGEDRSGRFFDAVRVAFRAGMLRGDVEDAMRQRPGGCASKYLKPDRLAAEIARAWGKVEAKAREEAEAAAPGVEPTYPNAAVPVDEARAALQAAVDAHFAAGTGQRAIRIGTGCGKTRAAVKAISADVRRRRTEGDRSAALYLTPTLALADEVAALFRAEGVRSRTFRGRGAEDPEMPGTGRAMCWDLEAVEIAVKLDFTVSTSCCKDKDKDTGITYHCPHFSDCGYQRQVTAEPDVWVGAHDLAFSAPSGLGEIGSLTIDEGWWQTGLRIAKRGTTLDDLGTSPGLGKNSFEMMAAADIAAWRSQLVAALRRQDGVGGVARRHLVEGGITIEMCNQANPAEWRMRDRVSFYPGMPKEARQAAARAALATGKIGKASAVWRAARDILEQEDEVAVSGRLVLAEVDAEDGSGKVRTVRTHGLRKIMKRWLDLPILLLDATLPPVEVLRCFLPDVKVVADIEAKALHARVCQVLGAPVSRRKLLASEAGRNREAVRRAILLRWVRAGRCPTLVICQKEAEEKFFELGLPKGIAVAHYNAIEGLDGFKDVGLLIAIGRTLPDVLEAETYAGALTGLEPVRTIQPEKGPRWYDRVPLALRMADGTGHPVQGDRHPGVFAEAARWSVCEAGVLQAIGRARAVNRTAENKVEIEVWSDLALPLTVDEVVHWDAVPAGYEADMIADGVWVESPSDMAICWPGVWETEKAAERWRAKGTRPPTSIENPLYRDWGACSARYQRTGPKQKWRACRFDPDVVSDPKGWLEARLGELKGFEIVDGG